MTSLLPLKDNTAALSALTHYIKCFPLSPAVHCFRTMAAYKSHKGNNNGRIGKRFRCILHTDILWSFMAVGTKVESNSLLYLAFFLGSSHNIIFKWFLRTLIRILLFDNGYCNSGLVYNQYNDLQIQCNHEIITQGNLTIKLM